MATDITDARVCFEDQYHIKWKNIHLKILKLEFRNEFFMRKIVQPKPLITHKFIPFHISKNVHYMKTLKSKKYGHTCTFVCFDLILDIRIGKEKIEVHFKLIEVLYGLQYYS